MLASLVALHQAAASSGATVGAPRLLKKASGLHRQALTLYRLALRAINSKPLEVQQELRGYARAEFERQHNVNPKNLMLVEHLIRVGHRRVETMSSSSVKGISHA